METSYTVQKNSGEMLDALAKRIMKRDRLDYSNALRVAMKENPATAQAYDIGILVVNEKSYAQLAEHEQWMIDLQNNPERTKALAGAQLEKHALALASSTTGVLGGLGQGQVAKERLERALNLLMDRFPSLR